MPSLRFTHLRRVSTARKVSLQTDDRSPHDWMNGLRSEVGKVCDVLDEFKRESDGNGKEAAALTADLADALAGVVIHLDDVLASLKLPLAPFGAQTFDAMRFGAGLDADERGPRDALRVGQRLLHGLEGVADTGHFLDFAIRVLLALDEIAYCYRIDLGDAVVRKFNATSEKHGMPHRLEVA